MRREHGKRAGRSWGVRGSSTGASDRAPGWDGTRCEQPCESEELVQGVAGFLFPVLSLLAVNESFSFYPKTLGSRAPRLHLGGVFFRQKYARTENPEAGIGLRPPRHAVSAAP